MMKYYHLLHSRVLIFILVLWYVHSCLALYEDEIGQSDWFKQNIGKIISVHSDSSKHGYFYTATNENVVSVLDSNDGEVIWRQVLPKNEGNPLVHYYNGYFVSVSNTTLHSQSSVIRLWREDSLVWQENTQNIVKDLKILGNEIVLLTPRSLEVFSIKDGSHISTIKIPGSHQLTTLFNSIGSKIIYAIGNEDILIFERGSVEKPKEIQNPLSLQNWVVSSEGYLIAIKDKHIHAYNLLSEKLDTTSISLKYHFDFSTNLVLFASGTRVIVTDNKTAIKIFTITSSPKLEIDQTSRDIKIEVPHGTEMDNIFLDSFSNVLVVFKDWSVVSIDSKSQVVWKREEALAAITQIEILDLPSQDFTQLGLLKDEFETPGLFTGFFHRIRSQIEQLVEFLNIKEQVQLSTGFDLIKDKFGFCKLIIALTKADKIVAIHSEKGRVVWSTNLPGSHLFVTRTSAHYPPEIVVINNQETNIIITSLNPLTGVISNTQKIHNPQKSTPQILPLPIVDNTYRKLIAFVLNSENDNDKKIEIYPQSFEASEIFTSYKNPIFYYSVNKSGEIIGHTLTQHNLWRVNLDEPVAEISLPHPQEKIYSPGVILGDRSLLVKYLNKNILGVATLAPKSKSKNLHIYLIDTITGNIIFHTYHTHSSTPIDMIQSENSIYYTYLDTKFHRYQIGVVDFFEKDVEWGNDLTYSSHTLAPPAFFYHQTFVLPVAVKFMTQSVTLRGITSRQIIFGTESDQVVGVDLKWLNPRRPQTPTPTQAEKDEGLIPYKARLTFHPQWFLSYNRTISRLRTIHTSSTYLESTSLVLSFGLDIFCTRTAPSDSYDLLNRDFNYAALVITCAVLCILTFITNRMAKRKDLGRLWK